jgi:hypothetical protein
MVRDSVMISKPVSTSAGIWDNVHFISNLLGDVPTAGAGGQRDLRTTLSADSDIRYPWEFIMRNTFLILLAGILLLPPSLFAVQPRVAVTIYNNDLALVREERNLSLRKGLQEYAYDGVTARIDATSVRFSAPGVDVLEQNFEYDLVDRGALMEKYLGEVIDVITEEDVVRGRLLSTRGGIILEDDDGNVRVLEQISVRSVRFPDLPQGLILRPTLRWLIDAEHTGDVDSELLYLTGGLSWEASYVALLGESEVEFSGWVQIVNRSGANFLDATLKLMAGDVRVLRDRIRGAGPERMLATDGRQKGFEEKEFFEYHLYTLPRPVTLHDNQTKQITLLTPRLVKAERTYLYDGAMTGEKVQVGVDFENTTEAGLGLPLPMGKVRLFKVDEADGSSQFVGEDRIGHTPEGEPVELIVGSAFDIVGERTRLDYKRLGDRGRQESWRIELRNRKDEMVTVTVREHLGGEWKILSESMTGSKTDASTREWSVKVPAKNSAEVSYEVRYN